MSLNLKLESYCFGTGLSLSCLICKIGIIIVPPSSGHYKMVKKKKGNVEEMAKGPLKFMFTFL